MYQMFLAFIKESSLTEDEALAATDGCLAECLIKVRTNRFFKYTDAWGVGLMRVVELLGGEVKEETVAKWANSLTWVFTTRIISTWEEFSANQLRMQSIEAMQKQLLIREKRRAATRLEKKAGEFESKKKAILTLNEVSTSHLSHLFMYMHACMCMRDMHVTRLVLFFAMSHARHSHRHSITNIPPTCHQRFLSFYPQAIAERRAQLIDEQRELKQKFEPEAYARLVAADVAASADNALK
jgi:hypothetical protein